MVLEMWLTCRGGRGNKHLKVVAQRRREGAPLLGGSLFESTSNRMQRTGGRENEECEKFETLNLFGNPYLLRVFDEFLEYLPDEKEDILVKGPILSLVRLYA